MNRRSFLATALALPAAGALARLSLWNSPADNTAAIVEAFPNVVLPPGRWEIDPVPFVSGVRLSGAGMRRTELVLSARTILDDPAFGGALNLHGAAGDPITDVTVSDLTVNGNASGLRLAGRTETLNVEAVSFSFAETCHMARVRAINANSDGFDYDDSTGCTTEDCVAEDCGGFGFHNSLRSHGNVHVRGLAMRCGFVQRRGGFDVHGTPGRAASGVTFDQCHTSGCYRGFLIGGDHNVLRGCSDEGSGEGLLVRGNDNRVERWRGAPAAVTGMRNVLT